MFHILVVEDDQALNKLICRVLTKNNYQVTAAFDGEEALSFLDQTYIDLIITDLMMPRMDGYDLTRELRESALRPKGLFFNLCPTRPSSTTYAARAMSPSM